MSDAASPLPVAVMKRPRHISVTWLVPILAIITSGWLGWIAWGQRGLVVVVRLNDGFGLQAGDGVRYRGITVGEVRTVELTTDLDGIVATLGLREQGNRLARAGARFWVVRPRLRLGGVEGVDTLLGPRYLALLPGRADATPLRHFIGLDEPPVVERIEPNDLEVIVQAKRRGSINPGAPVLYRQIRVGTVLSVGLASDAGGVEIRLHVRGAFRQLIRERTRFWDAGGVSIDASLAGISVEIDSLESALAGAVALATPPEDESGPVVRTGHRFSLAPESRDEWLRWRPLAVIGSALLPPDMPMASPIRARIAWKEGRLFRNTKSRRGWLLQTERGLLGPSDLLRPGENADVDTVELEVAGVVVPLDGEPVWTNGVLTIIDARVGRRPWPNALLEAPDQPVDCIAIADPATDPMPLAAARLDAADGMWRVDRSISIDESWHGAVVVARDTAAVIGVLLVDDGDASVVALLPADFE